MQTLIRQFDSKIINKIFYKNFNKLINKFEHELSQKNNKPFVWTTPFYDISKI